MAEEKPAERPTAVVQGKGSSGKKSLWKKVTDTFSVGNIHEARDYVISDVLIPGLLDILYDGITRGVGRVIYGEKGAAVRNSKGRSVDYHGIRRLSDGETIRKTRNETAVVGVYDYNEIELETKADADRLLDSMCEYLDIHDIISVADMYSMANYKDGDYTDNNWGWTSLAGAHVKRTSDGWTLVLPRVKNIKEA